MTQHTQTQVSTHAYTHIYTYAHAHMHYSKTPIDVSKDYKEQTASKRPFTLFLGDAVRLLPKHVGIEAMTLLNILCSPIFVTSK